MSQLPEVNKSFIEVSSKLNLVKPRKKFAPYTKADRVKRRNEVYRLHFELGLPAIRIAELMKVDKNTINNDINLLYKELGKEVNSIPYEEYLAKYYTRLETERAYLMDCRAKCNSLEDKLAVERLIIDIDIRLLHTTRKSVAEEVRVCKQVTKQLNDYAKNKQWNKRFVTPFELIEVSDKARMRIDKILKEQG